MNINKLRNIEFVTSSGERVYALRKAIGLTLEQFTFAMDVEISQVHRIEKGKVNPTLTTLIALAEGLDLPLSKLTEMPFNK